MKKGLKFFAGLIFGALTGSLAVLLLTPESGEETRLAISEKLQYLRNQIQAAAREKRVELEAEIERYKQAQ